MLLSWAIAAEQWTMPGEIDRVARLTPQVPVQRNPMRNPTVRMRLEDAVLGYRAAARLSANAEEAAVRSGFLLFRLGRYEDALGALDSSPVSSGDLGYLRQLFRGRVLTDIGKTDMAAGAYEAALAAWPRAPAATSALAALHALNGRHDMSTRYAVLARTQDGSPIDPWWMYWEGHARFLPVWLAQLRRASR